MYRPDVAHTVTSTLRRFPSLSALTVAKPAACAVSSPVSETEATEALLVAQVTGRSVSSLSSASRGAAPSWRVAPTPSATTPGVTATYATPTDRTVIAIDALRSSMRADTDTVP